MNLYEISNDYLSFMEAIESGDIPEESIADTLQAIEGDFESKIDNIACFVKSLEAESKAISDEAKNLVERSKAKQNKADRLREYIFSALKLTGIQKVETARNTVGIKKNPPKVVIDDESAFLKQYPDYAKIKTELDKASVKDALKGGNEFDGASLVQGESLSLK